MKKNLNRAGRSRRTAKLKYVSITIIAKLGFFTTRRQKKLQRSVGLNLGWNYVDSSSSVRVFAGVLTLSYRPATESTG